MKIKKGKTPNTHIPDDSVSDIAFLLLVFFMVTTVFKTEEGVRGLKLPLASKFEKVPKRKVVRIWIQKNGKVIIDDALVPVERVAGIMSTKKSEIPGLLVGFNTDKEANYGVVADVINQLKIAGTQRVSFNIKSANEQRKG